MMKKTAMVLVGALALGVGAPNVAQASDIQLWVNEAVVEAEASMGEAFVNEVGRTMIPLRVVNTYFDYATEWQKDGRIHITGKDGAVDVTLQLGDGSYVANGQSGRFDTVPLVKEGRTYLPARDFGELYGSVYWDQASHTVWMTDSQIPLYRVMGDSLMRTSVDGTQRMMLDDAHQVSALNGDAVSAVKSATDGKMYVAVQYDNNAARQCVLFRDEGTALEDTGVTVNATSSFAVDGETVYHTMGTDAGPWTGDIDPYRLLISDGSEERSRVLDFKVNECTLDMKDGKLIATDPKGVEHVIDSIGR